MDHLFDSIVVSDEIGVAKPDKAFFDYVYTSIEHDVFKDEVLVIGDNLKADIGGARDYGFKTCWISHRQLPENGIFPDITIPDISHLTAALNKVPMF